MFVNINTINMNLDIESWDVYLGTGRGQSLV